jgi:hypothetical protein
MILEPQRERLEEKVGEDLGTAPTKDRDRGTAHK